MKPNIGTYYYSIAGCKFCIRFHPTSWLKIQEKLKRELLEYLKSFAVDKSSKSSEIQLDIVWNFNTKHIQKDNRGYLNIYKIINNKKIKCYYNMSIIDFQIILGYFLFDWLTTNNGFLLHASAVLINDMAFVFPGQSGAGKSTIRHLLSPPYESLSDETIAIRKTGKTYYLYQLPFIEKNTKSKKTKRRIKIKRLYFLEKETYISEHKMTNTSLILDKFMLSYKYFNVTEQQKKKLLQILLQFISENEDKFYTLHFPKNKEELVKYFSKEILMK